MTAAETYDFEKLAREIVASRLKSVEKPQEAIAEIAKKIIVTGVSSTKIRQDPRATVAAVCRGLMSGLLLVDQPLPPSAVTVLTQMAAVAQEVPLDPGDLMTWGMEGIAQAAHLGGRDVQSKIQDAIEEKFHGAGEIFGKICSKLAAKDR